MLTPLYGLNVLSSHLTYISTMNLADSGVFSVHSAFVKAFL